MKKTIFILSIIFILGATLRFYRLGEIPVGFHRDEAFLGYNAYSILQTGKDISGNFLPLHLESFLYSPAGYSYLSIPFIKFYDLSAFSVRFASALFGTLTVVIAFFLTRELFSKSAIRDKLSAISAFLLAISPWHINLSRTATENVLVVFFISLGVLLFLTWQEKQKWYLLFLSFLSFGTTLFLYQASRAFLPIFIPFMVFILAKKYIERTRLMQIMIFFFCLILAPLLTVLFSKELSLRLRTVSIFSTAESQLIIDEQAREDGVSNVPRFFTRAFHNKPLTYSSQVLQNYFKHFSYDFLFTDKGLPDRYRIPLTGLLFIFELPLIISGVWYLLRIKNSVGVFLLGWLLLAPLGSALTFDDVPNLQRTLIIFPALSIIEAVGFISFISIFKTKRLFLPILIAGGLVALYSLLFYLHQYYVHGPRYRAWYRHDGYKELVYKVNQNLPNYNKAIITNHDSAPAIFFLFFSKYDPSHFQEETKGSAMRDFDRIGFGKYEFSQEECSLKEFEERTQSGEKRIVSPGKKEILYVNFATCPIPKNIAQLLDEIRRSDGSAVFQILRVQRGE